MQALIQQIPYTTFVRQFVTAPSGKLYCLHGTYGAYRLSLYAAAHALLRESPIAIVDGANRFDAYYFAEFARRFTEHSKGRVRLTPEQLLDNIFISRAFTCYQMEAVMTHKLPEFLTRTSSRTAVVFGLLDTFYDEQAPIFEVKAGMQRIRAVLHQLKRSGVSLLLASRDVRLASKERNSLFPQLLTSMDKVFRVSDDGGGMQIFLENTSHNNSEGHHGKDSTNVYTGHSAGNGKLVEVSPGLAHRRPGST